MKLVDLDKQIFVPITDESKGGVTYEMGMSLGEFLDGICEGFKPEVVDAMPVEWLRGLMNILATGDANGQGQALFLSHIINEWENQQGEME